MNHRPHWATDLRARIQSLFTNPALSTDDLQAYIRDLLAIPELTQQERAWLEADLRSLDYIDHELWLLPDVNERIRESVVAHVDAVANRLTTEPGNGQSRGMSR